MLLLSTRSSSTEGESSGLQLTRVLTLSSTNEGLHTIDLEFQGDPLDPWMSMSSTLTRHWHSTDSGSEVIGQESDVGQVPEMAR